MAQPGHSRGIGRTVCGYLSGRVGRVQHQPVAVDGNFVMRVIVALALLLTFSLAQADGSRSPWGFLKGSGGENRYLYVSLYTTHYDPRPEHVNDQNMLGFEFDISDSRLWGFAMFDNSYGQDSQYLYVGKKWRLLDSNRWYFKLTGGLLHGYEEPYEDKIPLNDLGIAPAAIPAVGYRYKNFYAEFVQLGVSAGMINVGMNF